MITSFLYPDGKRTPLSNFWRGTDIYADLRPVSDINVWPTAEHLYQASKTLRHADIERIHAAATPGQAKRLGRFVELRSDWERAKLDVMRSVLRAKFAKGTPELAYLLATGDHQLVECNTWGDTFWGVYRGMGRNWLGFLLMGVRAERRDER